LTRKIRKRKQQKAEEDPAEKVKRSAYFSVPADGGGGPSGSCSLRSDQPAGRRLELSDFSLPCEELARSLVGALLCRQSGGQVLRGKVVEVESYPGRTDGASHSFRGETERNKAMFMEPGTAYVYSIYGMYHCFNVSSQGEGAAVLIRSIQPLQGLEVMRTNREARRKAGAKPMKEKDLCNGPSKLCQALDIDKNLNCSDLISSEEIWFEDCGVGEDDRLVQTTRVGIEGSGAEWAGLELRWYLLANNHVSVRDRQAEARLDLPR